MIAHPITQPVQAWQYTDIVRERWPAWARRCCFTVNGELIHDRQSGRQVVNQGEWLVMDLDGGVNFYTTEEFERTFAAGAQS
jgi:hypothetical protein